MLKRIGAVLLAVLLLAGCARQDGQLPVQSGTETDRQAKKADAVSEIYGFVYNQLTSQNDLVVLNLENGRAECLLSVDRQVAVPCALSPDKKTFAYVTDKQEDMFSAQYLVCREAETGEETVFFDDAERFQWIEGVVFLPDGEQLIVTVCRGQKWNDMSIYKLQLATGEKKLLSQAYFDEDEPFPTQEELDELIGYYGGEARIPVEENIGFNYVNFSYPALSADGTKLYYSATLYRSATPGYQEGMDNFPLHYLASGIWELDLVCGGMRLLQADAPRSYIGRVAVSPGGGRLAFAQMGKNTPVESYADLVAVDRMSGEKQTILPHTPQAQIYYPRCFIDENRLLVFTVETTPQGEAPGTLIYHFETGEAQKQAYSYNGTPVTVERLFPLWQEK